jgi:hypothetical protein
MTYGVNAISIGGSTTLTYTLSNTNAISLTGVGFSDTLPAILGATFILNQANNCGGSLAETAGAVVLSGVTLAAGGSCTVIVGVQGISAGTAVNSAFTSSTQTGTSLTPATVSSTVNGRNGITFR